MAPSLSIKFFFYECVSWCGFQTLSHIKFRTALPRCHGSFERQVMWSESLPKRSTFLTRSFLTLCPLAVPRPTQGGGRDCRGWMRRKSQKRLADVTWKTSLFPRQRVVGACWPGAVWVLAGCSSRGAARLGKTFTILIVMRFF